jgi:hypothetical protein
MQTKENLKEMYSFTEVYDAYDQKKTYVTFKRQPEDDDVIVQQFETFIDNIEYCRYTGLLLKKVEETDFIFKYEIIDNRQINNMRKIMFMQICNKEEKWYITNEKKWIEYTWNQLLGYATMSPWDVEIEVQQNEPDLIQYNRTKPKHYLYVILDTMTNMHKIGITGNLKKRYKTLLSDRFCLVVEWACVLEDKKYAEILEKKAHQYFSHYRNKGEWFNLSHTNIIDIQMEIETIASNLGYEIYDENIEWSYDNRYNNDNGKG